MLPSRYTQAVMTGESEYHSTSGCNLSLLSKLSDRIVIYDLII